MGSNSDPEPPGAATDAAGHTEGLLGRGQITDVQPVAMISGSEEPPPDYVFGVRVFLDGVEPYEARCRQAIPAALIPQLASGQRTVAVRVDPDHPADIALDLDVEPPTVQLPAAAPAGSASEIIATGRVARVTIVQSSPTGLRSAAGVDLHSFVLTVTLDGQAPYQCQTTQPVPPDAVALIYPGSTLPAFVASNNDGAVAIHWDAGIAVASQPAS